MSTLQITEGRTAPIDEQLTADGVAVDLTGCTVVLLLTDRTGALVDTAGDASVLDAATGKVRYLPDPTDLVASGSPYRARWQVTDAQTKISFFPEGPGDTWTVYRQ